jgi:hypothetical protein
VALNKDDIQAIFKDGLYMAGFAVEPTDKLTTTWADIKTQD